MLAKLSVKRESHLFIGSNPSCYYQTYSAPTSPRVQAPDKIGIQSNLDRHIQAIFACVQWIWQSTASGD